MTPLWRGRRPIWPTLYGIPLTILLVAGGASATQEPQLPVISAFPHDPDNEVRTEIGLIIKDLRAARHWVEGRRAQQKKSNLGADFYAPGAQREALGIDLLVEMTRLIDLAAPSRGGQTIMAATDPRPPHGPAPIPAAVVSFTVPGGAGIQGLLKVEPGFIDRVTTALASETPPAWEGTIEEGELVIPAGDYRIVGRVGEDGWLRLAASEGSLVGAVIPDPEPFFAEDMLPWVDSSDGMLFVRGGGDASMALAAIVNQPLISDILIDMRMMVLGWRLDRGKTTAARLLVDAPTLENLRLKLRRPDLHNHLVALWDDDATRFLSLSLPPALLGSLMPWIEAQLGERGIDLTDEVRAGVEGLDGRLGIAYFGSPGDWAAGIQLEEAATAEALVPALQQWGASAAVKAGLETTQLPTTETVGGIQVLHARPDPATEGLRVAAVDATVVAVTQRRRLEELLAHERAGRLEPDSRATISSHLAPEVRALIEEPAMLMAYMVLGDTGELYQYAAIALGLLKDGWRATFDQEPRFELYRKLLTRAPTLLTLEGFSWALLYDLAISADLDGSVLVVQLLASEI